MTDINYIKSEIQKLYNIGAAVHVKIRTSNSKSINKTIPVTITGIYSNIFSVKEMGRFSLSRHSFQYGEILTGQVAIEELDFCPVATQIK